MRGWRGGAAGANGFGLVEVLVASVVLAIGLIGGLLALIDGARATRQSLLESAAVRLGSDLGDRIRANRRAGIAYGLADGRMLARPATDCTSTRCDAAALAAADLYEWQRLVLATLPDPRMSVAVDASPGGPRYEIVLAWSDGGRTVRRRQSSVVEP